MAGVPFGVIQRLAAPLARAPRKPGGGVPFSEIQKLLAPAGVGAGAAGAPEDAEALPVFHGSPHKFTKFLSSKIGSGEGAQSYGHGLYFAENPKVARSYINSTGDPPEITIKGKPLSDFDPGEQAFWEEYAYKGRDAVLAELREHIAHFKKWDPDPHKIETYTRYLKNLEAVRPSDVRIKSGHLYHADIPDEAIERMLDWDKPLSEQPEWVRNTFEKVFNTGSVGMPNVTGGQAYFAAARRHYGSKQATSAAMKAAGIPGIKYFDQGSRAGGKGTRNIVLFDESLAKVLRRQKGGKLAAGGTAVGTGLAAGASDEAQAADEKIPFAELQKLLAAKAPAVTGPAPAPGAEEPADPLGRALASGARPGREMAGYYLHEVAEGQRGMREGDALGKAAGALQYAGAGYTALIRSAAGKPLERLTGMPSWITELGLGLVPFGGKSAALRQFDQLSQHSKKLFKEQARNLKETGPFTRFFSTVYGGKAISALDQLAAISPTARELRESIQHSDTGAHPVPRRPGQFDLSERVLHAQGRFKQPLVAALDSLRRGLSGGISNKSRSDLTASLRADQALPGTERAYRRIRDTLDQIHAYAREAGMEIGYLKGYFPRVYNPVALEKNIPRFVETLKRYGIEEDSARLIAQKIIDEDGVYDVTRTPFARPSSFAAEKGRALAEIPDKELAGFLYNDPQEVLLRYTDAMVRRAESTRIFGQKGEKLLETKKKIADEALAAGRAMTRFEHDRIDDLYAGISGNYGRISARAQAALDPLIAYQYIRTLPLATLSSLTEPLLLLERGRWKSVALRGIPAAGAHAANALVRSIYKRYPKAEATAALEAVGYGQDYATVDLIRNLFKGKGAGADVGVLGEGADASRMGGRSRAATDLFFRANLLDSFTRFTRVMSYHSGIGMIEHHARDLARGAKSARKLVQLKALGLDPQQAIAWVKGGAKKDDPYFEHVQKAGLRFVNDVVIHPTPATRSMWQSSAWAQLPVQLQSYQQAFGNTVVKRMVKKLVAAGRDPLEATKAVIAFSAMTALALFTNEHRQYLTHGEKGNPHLKEPWDKFVAAVDRAGFTGAAQKAIDWTVPYRFGPPPDTALGGVVQTLGGPAGTQAARLEETGRKALLSGRRKDEKRFKEQVILAIPGPSSFEALRKPLREELNF